MAIVEEVCVHCGATAFMDAKSYPLKRPVLCYLDGLDLEIRGRYGYPVFKQFPPKGGK